jgi:thiol-disulfide isomerase/thioredoxin
MKSWLVALALIGASVPVLEAQESGIPVGARAPVVTVNDLDGRPVDLGQYIGKRPVFLEFWATWCEQCDALRAAQAAYGSQVEFFGVNVTVNQSPERVRKYLQTHQPGFRPLYDDQGTSIRAFQVPATSYVVILDRAGKVVYTGTGGSQEFDDVLRKVVRN